jgi:two-component system, cell cycle sensor histidine kinase and response regulator CckA
MHEIAQAALIRRARLPIGIQNERSSWVFRLLILGLIAIPSVAAAQSPPPPQVLILHSHHLGYEWTEDIAAGIRSVFQENGVAADPHVEFMDGRRHGSSADLERLRDYYEHKFQNLKFGVIISSDDTALGFLLQNHQRLFPQTPVVFCGVGMIERYDLSRQPLFTGFAEVTDNQETVALALKLHPQAQRVVVVSDLQKRWSDLEQAFPQRKFVFLDPQNLELSELLNRLRQIPPDSVGLLEAFFGNRFGQTFTASQVTRLISENCQFPVYGVNANTFRHGIVGGKLNDGYFQGVEAARRALAILKGTAPRSLPIVRESMNHFQFDYKQLQRWQIDPSRLPPGSLMVNRPASLYEQHAAIIWTGAAFLALQSVAISVLLFNIRQRHKAEVRLRASEDNLEKAQSIAHIGSWDHNLLNGRLWWSPETYRIFGYDEERPVVSLEFFLARVHPEDCAAVLRASSEARQHGKAYSVEHRILRPDGKERLVQQHAEVITGRDGKAARLVGTTQDITDLRSLEGQLRHSQKLEAVGRLAGGIAHDFNNLLTAINGYCDLILDDLPAEDPLRSDLFEIRRAGERAATLTRQLLAFSRKQVLEPRVINLNTIVAGMDNMLRRLLGEDIELHTHFEPDLGLVKADPGQLEQVILNLAVNARDAMPNGGKLTIETSNAVLDEDYARKHQSIVPGSYTLLAVSDTGCGMDSETQAHLFEPFFTTKDLGKGTGLGLSMVYGIVKQSGGSIWVYSEPRQGSTFKIYLPTLQETREADATLEPPEKLADGSETVLVVEDESAVRSFTRMVLQRSGYRVIEASNGEEALSRSRAHRGEIQLLVTDMVMPGMGGRQVAEALERQRPRVRVLYLSGYTENAIAQRGALGSELPFLQKPFTMEALLRKVRQVLDQPAKRESV